MEHLYLHHPDQSWELEVGLSRRICEVVEPTEDEEVSGLTVVIGNDRVAT